MPAEGKDIRSLQTPEQGGGEKRCRSSSAPPGIGRPTATFGDLYGEERDRFSTKGLRTHRTQAGVDAWNDRELKEKVSEIVGK